MTRKTWTRTVVALLVLFVLGPFAPPLRAQRDPWIWVDRYTFEIDPKTPLKDMLPTPPRAAPLGKLLVDDLASVPEVRFQEAFALHADAKHEGDLTAARQKVLVQTLHQIARINYLNQQKTDLFLQRLLENRPDLAGLPFMMGDACRLTEEAHKQFRHEIRDLRELLAKVPVHSQRSEDHPDAVLERTEKSTLTFWMAYENDRQLKKIIDQGSKADREKRQAIEDRCALAAMMQMLGTEGAPMQRGLVGSMSLFEKSAAGKELGVQALARLALFSMDEPTRKAARKALSQRDTGPATAILLYGLRYPWPSVAKNAAEAIVELKRTDLLPELVRMLEEPDPRAPTLQVVQGKKTPMVRELVRINHHRNCLLCHAPADTADIYGKVRALGETKIEAPGAKFQKVGLESLDTEPEMAPVQIPGLPFSSGAEYYSQFRTPDILVRADVTYLRQDFSLMQKVANADPWPTMQRFDFLVRSRVLSEKEAETYQTEIAAAKVMSPYRQAALDALRF